MSQNIRKLGKSVLLTFTIYAETKLVKPILNYWEVNDNFEFFLYEDLQKLKFDMQDFSGGELTKYTSQ